MTTQNYYGYKGKYLEEHKEYFSEKRLKEGIKFILSRRILQPFKAGDECDTFCERSEQYGRM